MEYAVDFDDIRPYRDNEVVSIIQGLLQDPEFVEVITRFRFAAWPSWVQAVLKPLVHFRLQRQVRNITTVDGFQDIIESYVFKMIKETTDGLSISGIEKLSKDESYLFISNHRDIVVDPAFVNWALYHHDHSTLRIAIGDNLLTKPYVSDLMRLNKSFIVNRSATKPREKLKAAKHLSAYIHHSIVNENANVWIAQREGRAKDGLDRTNSAVVGMILLNKPKDQPLAEYVRTLNIVPVSISYECDPCDLSKAQELFMQDSEGHYEKAEHEDAASIARGITGYKGRVHLAFGDVLQDNYEDAADIVAELDHQIISRYVLQPSHCLAYKALHGKLPKEILVTEQAIPFEESYFVKESRCFRERLLACDERYRDFLLHMYANPIISQLT